MSQLFNRAYSLLVTAPGSDVNSFSSSADSTEFTTTGSTTAGTGLDLSQLQFRFETKAPDVQTPNTAIIRVWNAAANTVKQIQSEYSGVILQAGYQGNIGQIFAGTIKQVKKGRVDAVSSYVDIYAADGDLAHNNAVMNQTLAAGAGPQDVAQAIGSSFGNFGVSPGTTFTNVSGGILPRGKVLFGMTRAAARNLAKTAGVTWSIQNGVMTWTPLNGYLPGEAVVLSSKTGMIGVPEATEQGIRVRCLINPKIVVGGLVQINNASINQTQIKSQGFPDYTSINFVADTTWDGFYKVIMAESVGDTRGTEWYWDLTCLAVDTSAPQGSQVPGGQ